MKIGIDFGTSFSSAAAVLDDGRIEHILFNGQPQFRTSVFFPDRAIDTTAFKLTARYEQEIDIQVRHAKIQFGKQLESYEEAMRDIANEISNLASNGKPLSAAEIADKRALYAKPIPRSDEELSELALRAIKRRWMAEELAKAKDEEIQLDAAIFGEDAIDALYIYESGRLIQSPKSMLGFRLEQRQRSYITSIISRILKHIRERASAQLGRNVTQATLGRPVVFRSSMGPSGVEQAISILTEAAIEAGFTSVDFLAEPAAAAVGYHAMSSEPHRALIIDIGGGTTDIALADVGGNAPHPFIYETWGEPKGGTDVDLGLSLRAAMHLFGRGVCPELLAPVFVDAASVSDLNRQKTFRERRFPHTAEPYASRLAQLQQPGMTVRLNHDVEGLKVDLSIKDESSRALDYINKDLAVSATRKHLHDGAESFMRTFRGLLQRVKDDTPGESPVLFMTGGMSRAPYVIEAVKQVYPNLPFAPTDASLGVVNGLALYASRS